MAYVPPHRRRRLCRCLSSTTRPLFEPPEHAVRARVGLLGETGRFCSAFFHVIECYEFGTETVCLRDDPTACGHNTCCIVARLHRAGETLYVARYFNCFRGSGESNVHAEEFVFADASLAAAMQDGDTLVLYSTYQPCHFSSGGMSRAGRSDRTSCTERILAWHGGKRVKLRVAIANVYRASWTEPDYFETEAERRHFVERTQLAREGIKKLLRAGIDVDAFDPDDWQFLTALAEPGTAARAKDAMPERLKADEHIRSFLATMRLES